MDNVILVHEVIHSLKTTQTPGMLINLDLSKYFDKLSWKYMHSLLSSFGFSTDWISWIMKLTSSVFFSILVNGVPSRPFSPYPRHPSRRPTLPFPLCNHGRRFREVFICLNLEWYPTRDSYPWAPTCNFSQPIC
jgi:hypothetical protein